MEFIVSREEPDQELMQWCILVVIKAGDVSSAASVLKEAKSLFKAIKETKR